MSVAKGSRLEKCAYCGGIVTTRCGYGGILFFDCATCGACVSFKNAKYPFRVQADDPVACFNRRYHPRVKKRGAGK